MLWLLCTVVVTGGLRHLSVRGFGPGPSTVPARQSTACKNEEALDSSIVSLGARSRLGIYRYQPFYVFWLFDRRKKESAGTRKAGSAQGGSLLLASSYSNIHTNIAYHVLCHRLPNETGALVLGQLGKRQPLIVITLRVR